MAHIGIWGDSITYGAGMPSGSSWVDQLRNNLFERDKDSKIYNLGINGDTTAGLLQRFKQEYLEKSPDSVIFAIGINDSAWQGRRDNNFVPFPQFESNLEKLVQEAREFTQAITVVGLTNVDESETVEDDSPELCYSNDMISKYNSALQDFSKRHSLSFVPLFGILETSDLEDGLHPNAIGHRKIFERVRQFLK